MWLWLLLCVISSVGGLILDKTVSDPNFKGMAVFTPVINGKTLKLRGTTNSDWMLLDGATLFVLKPWFLWNLQYLRVEVVLLLCKLHNTNQCPNDYDIDNFAVLRWQKCVDVVDIRYFQCFQVFQSRKSSVPSAYFSESFVVFFFKVAINIVARYRRIVRFWYGYVRTNDPERRKYLQLHWQREGNAEDVDSNWFMLSCSEVCVAFPAALPPWIWAAHSALSRQLSPSFQTECFPLMFRRDVLPSASLFPPLHPLASSNRSPDWSPFQATSARWLLSNFSLSPRFTPPPPPPPSPFLTHNLFFLFAKLYQTTLIIQWRKMLNHSRKESNRWWVENWMTTWWRISFVLIFQVGFICQIKLKPVAVWKDISLKGFTCWLLIFWYLQLLG